MYAVGGLFYHIAESSSLKHTASEKMLLNIAEKCRLVQYHRQWSARKALLTLQETFHMQA